MRDMHMDKTELGCLRAIVLFNPGTVPPGTWSALGSPPAPAHGHRASAARPPRAGHGLPSTTGVAVPPPSRGGSVRHPVLRPWRGPRRLGLLGAAVPSEADGLSRRRRGWAGSRPWGRPGPVGPRGGGRSQSRPLPEPGPGGLRGEGSSPATPSASQTPRGCRTRPRWRRCGRRCTRPWRPTANTSTPSSRGGEPGPRVRPACPGRPPRAAATPRA